MSDFDGFPHWRCRPGAQEALEEWEREHPRAWRGDLRTREEIRVQAAYDAIEASLDQEDQASAYGRDLSEAQEPDEQADEDRARARARRFFRKNEEKKVRGKMK
jgi:hypothetical protein